MNRVFEPVVEVSRKFWNGLSALIGALIVFLIGWLAAKFLRLLITRFFKTLGIDKLAEDSGLKTLLEKGNITKDVSELLGIAVYWIIMLVVIFTSINFAGLNIPPTVIDSLLGFIPKFILGLLIFIFSIFLGTFFNGIVRTSAGNVGIRRPATLGKITQIAIVVFGIAIALQEIGIAPEFINNVFTILLAAFAFGSALAFALGAKDIVKKNLEEFLAKQETDKENKQ